MIPPRPTDTRRPLTLRDVSEACGVSEMTVSRVLRNRDDVSPATREKVLTAARALGYVPNKIAGGLASQQVNLVAVIVPSLSNMVFPEVLSGISAALEDSGLQPVFGVTNYSAEKEEEVLYEMLSWRPSGVIIAGLEHTEAARAMLENAGIPIVEIMDSDGEPIDSVVGISHRAAGRQMAEAMQQDHAKDPRGALLAWIVEEKGRVGRKGGKGFYEYGDDGKPTRIWPGLSEKIEVKVKECPPELKHELTKRFLFRQCVEVARCFEEGVITDPRDADVGSILAWGFAPYSGGCVSYIDLFWGTKAFVEEADRLADAYGERFRPNKLLRDMAAKGETFYERFGAKEKKAA